LDYLLATDFALRLRAPGVETKQRTKLTICVSMMC
jgi:hypothetical protein